MVRIRSLLIHLKLEALVSVHVSCLCFCSFINVFKEILRIALEDSGYLGYIQVSSSTTLADCRNLILNEVENAPSSFTFLLNGELPISSKQESQPVRSFLPTVTLRVLGSPTTQRTGKFSPPVFHLIEHSFHVNIV